MTEILASVIRGSKKPGNSKNSETKQALKIFWKFLMTLFYHFA